MTQESETSTGHPVRSYLEKQTTVYKGHGGNTAGIYSGAERVRLDKKLKASLAIDEQETD